MSIFIILTIAVSLSMDAFSLSLVYGTLSLPKKHIIKLSIIVGVFHFLMPLFGMILGNVIFNIININSNTIIFLILTFIGIQMIIDSFKDDNTSKYMSFWQLILFGFAVSIDSFSVGIGLNKIGISPVINSFIFSLSSFIFTYLGLILGKKLNSYIGKISTIIGGLILILIGLIYLF